MIVLTLLDEGSVADVAGSKENHFVDCGSVGEDILHGSPRWILVKRDSMFLKKFTVSEEWIYVKPYLLLRVGLRLNTFCREAEGSGLSRYLISMEKNSRCYSS